MSVEQWRAAVGAMAAKASTPKPRSPIGPHRKKCRKASDPVAYKGCVVLLVSIAQLVCCDVEQAEEETKEMVNKGSECGLQLVSRRKTKVGNRPPNGCIGWFNLTQIVSTILLIPPFTHLSLKYFNKCEFTLSL